MDHVAPPTSIALGAVTLTRWTAGDDRRALAAVRASLPELIPWMPWASDAYDEVASAAFLARAEEEWATGAAYDYALLGTAGEGAADPDGPVLGSAGMHRRIGPGGMVVGYWVHSAHAGHGLGTRAAAGLTAAALALPDVTHVEIHHDAGNRASGRIPEKLGFTRVGEIGATRDSPGATGVHVIWRLDAADYPTSPIPALLRR